MFCSVMACSLCPHALFSQARSHIVFVVLVLFIVLVVHKKTLSFLILFSFRFSFSKLFCCFLDIDLVLVKIWIQWRSQGWA